MKYYREAEELKKRKVKSASVVTGVCISMTHLIGVAPILHAFAKKGTKAQPYVEQAYPISKGRLKKRRRMGKRLKHKREYASWKRTWCRTTNDLRKEVSLMPTTIESL